MNVKKKRIIGIIIIFIILCGIIWIVSENQNEANIGEEENEIKQEISNNEQNIEKNKEEEKQYPKAEVIETYNGYKVAAKLEIPTINLET